MNNPFEGKAIKFDTSEQLDHLAELARGYGLTVGSCTFEPYCYFRSLRLSETQYDTFSIPKPNDTEIHYSDFVASIEEVKFTDSRPNQQPDMVNHPPIDVISIAQQFNLNYTLGRALECLLKKDIEKAIWYLQRENKTK